MIGLEVLRSTQTWVTAPSRPTWLAGRDLGVIVRGDDKSKIIKRMAPGQPVGSYQSLSRRLRVTHRNSK
jgi:hypothetical protein